MIEDSLFYDGLCKKSIDLKLFTVSALLDYSPFNNGFITTAGLMYNRNKLDYVGKATNGTYNINGEVFNAIDVGSLNGKIDFNTIAPYLGVDIIQLQNHRQQDGIF